MSETSKTRTWRDVGANFTYELTEVPMVPLFIFFALFFALGVGAGTLL